MGSHANLGIVVRVLELSPQHSCGVDCPLSFIQIPNLQAHPIPLANSPSAEVGGVSVKPHTWLGMAALVVLTAGILSPMSGPGLAVGYFGFPVLGMEPKALHKPSHIP